MRPPNVGQNLGLDELLNAWILALAASGEGVWLHPDGQWYCGTGSNKRMSVTAEVTEYQARGLLRIAETGGAKRAVPTAVGRAMAEAAGYEL